MSLTGSSGTTPPNKSSQTFLTALVTGLITLSVEVGVFMIIRNRFRKIYNPRSYLVPPKQRVDALPHGLLAWIPAIIKAPSVDIIAKNGLDAYVFVRFLYLMMEIFLPFSILTWVILIPVDVASSKGTNTGIERLTFGNVGNSQSPRFAAHLIVVWILTFYVFYLVKRELAAFVILRQDFLMSKAHSKLSQSKTVLVTGVAKEYLTVEGMTKFCSVLPGGVKRVWIARNLGDLPDVYDRRTKASGKLESAETGYMKAAAKAILKEQKSKKGATTKDVDLEADQGTITRWVPQKKRPTHKLGFLGLWGKKVDSIDWAREEIVTTNTELQAAQEILAGSDASTKYPHDSAAFIQFNKQIAAHMFAQSLAHHAPLRMSSRYVEVAQEDVIWGNLPINPYQAKIRYMISWAMTIGLIILWAFPVAFVGLISNVSQLCVTAPFLAWLCKLPTPVNGIIQGVLPPVALAVLFILLPIVLRLFAKFQGIPLHTLIELSLMTRYFLFLVIHGFLIVTLASGLVASIPLIAKNPSSAVTLLAQKLPAASTFFLTWIATTALAGAAGSLLQIVTLIVYYVKLFILGSTPRAVFGIKYNMSGVAWGTLFPNITLMMVIGFTYSVIAPLVSGMALVAFALYWFVYKYLFLWVYDTPATSETGGLFYPKALAHIFVGLYIEQICLTGLFFLHQNENGKQDAIAEGALMVVLIVITILYQITLNSGYQPLIAYLPLSVASKIDEIQGVNEPVTQELHAGDEKTTFPPPGRKSQSDGENLLHHKNGADNATLPGDEHLSPHAFDHPATYEKQRTIWIPVDSHGFYSMEQEGIQAAGIAVSSEGAAMNEKGKVDVTRSPPDDDWDETQTI